MTRYSAWLGLWVATVGVRATAQDIDQAIQAYNDDQYRDAAYLFFDVKENGTDADAKVRAEYYLAHSLYRAGYLLPAYQFYGEVFNQGESHPYFLKATSGLLNIAKQLRDDTLIPEIINKGYAKAFSGLKREDLNAINYMIGMVTQRRGDQAEAKQFLEAVTKESSYFVRAQYLLAIMAVKQATQEGAEDYSRALRYFENIEKGLEGKNAEDDKKLYRLALLGKARALYSQGDFEKSIANYEKVPRFSEDWYDAMFESGWAYFQAARFGRALGMVHSIQAPYFDDRFRAESWVLKATTYFQLCHFDRARTSIDEFFRIYEPIAAGLKNAIAEDRADEQVLSLIAEGDPSFPEEVRSKILGNRRYQRFAAQVALADAEFGKAKAEFPEGNFKSILLELLRDMRADRIALTANLVKGQLKREAAFLDDFLSQAGFIKFETADAERKMLEAGKDITKGPRARGPRPKVPDARHQYWGFSGEYWIDELGYYEHAIGDECIPEIFGGAAASGEGR